MRMQVELCLLQLQRGGTLTVLPVSGRGPPQLLSPATATTTLAATATATAHEQQETLLLLPLLRRVPGAPLGCHSEESPSFRVYVQLDEDGDSTASDLWGAASGLLLQYLIEQQQLLQLQHRHVIELGCGLGAVSCLCSLLGVCGVCTTDGDPAAVLLSSCNMSLAVALRSHLILPSAASAAAADRSAAACGAPANALASAAVDLLEGIRSKVKQHQQLLQQEEEELAVSSLLQELPQVPAATLGLLRWSESRAEVLQQLQQLQQQEQQAAAGAATPFSLVVASDVLYSDRSARLLACTIKSIAAAAATGAAAVGPSRCSAPSFLCLISHQVRHAVYLEQQQVVKEAADSCLQTFIREFCPTKEDNRTSFASLYAAKPLRQQQQPLTAAAEPAAAAAAATAGVPPAAGSAGELYVHLITTRPAAAAATAELELREGDVCLVAIAADPQQLLQLPPAVAPAGAAMLQAL